ncbi:MAG: DUF167 domain-containing protein [Patescibacteria group bacterium]|jgi:hypothetical protein
MQILVEVKPNSSKVQVEKITDQVYKVKLTAPPAEGKANIQLIKVLSDYFEVSKSRVTIKTGKTSKTKVVIISG